MLAVDAYLRAVFMPQLDKKHLKNHFFYKCTTAAFGQTSVASFSILVIYFVYTFSFCFVLTFHTPVPIWARLFGIQARLYYFQRTQHHGNPAKLGNRGYITPRISLCAEISPSTNQVPTTRSWMDATKRTNVGDIFGTRWNEMRHIQNLKVLTTQRQIPSTWTTPLEFLDGTTTRI